jgi:hypothetical protein
MGTDVYACADDDLLQDALVTALKDAGLDANMRWLGLHDGWMAIFNYCTGVAILDHEWSVVAPDVVAGWAASAAAKWDNEDGDDDVWRQDVAKMAAFLRVCAEHGAGLWFC